MATSTACSYDLDAYRDRARGPDSSSAQPANAGHGGIGDRRPNDRRDARAQMHDDARAQMHDDARAEVQGDARAEVSTGSDSGPDSKLDGPVITLHPVGAATVVVPTSGGGTAASARYRATLTIGAPQPSGTASSDTFTATIGLPGY